MVIEAIAAKKILMDYLPQIILVVAMLALYYVWHSHVYDSGYNAANSEWSLREAKIQSDMAQVRREAEDRVWKANNENRSKYMGAVEAYAESYRIATDDLNRHKSNSLRVNTKTGKCSSGTMPGAGSNTKTDSGRLGEIFTVEIIGKDAEDIREVMEEVRRGEDAAMAMIEYLKNSGLKIQ